MLIIMGWSFGGISRYTFPIRFSVIFRLLLLVPSTHSFTGVVFVGSREREIDLYDHHMIMMRRNGDYYVSNINSLVQCG